ncbi:MAG: hypothetical protein GXP47_13215, partial [Acidobacteria bacterium]|nr:hypothetical protein [Acidobacteriota bacterium]
MSRGARFSIMALLISAVAGCTLVSRPEPFQYDRPPSIWRDGSVSLRHLETYRWKPSSDEGLEADSLPMAPGVVRRLRQAIVDDLAPCYRLKSSGPADFWIAFRLEPPAANGKTPAAGPRLVISVG